MTGTPQPDRDVYNLLVELNGLVRGTASKVDSMHAELFGENGHLSRMDGHIGRLYKRTEELARKDTELEKKIAESAKPARYALERGRGVWMFIVGSALLIDIVLRLVAFAKGH